MTTRTAGQWANCRFAAGTLSPASGHHSCVFMFCLVGSGCSYCSLYLISMVFVSRVVFCAVGAEWLLSVLFLVRSFVVPSCCVSVGSSRLFCGSVCTFFFRDSVLHWTAQWCCVPVDVSKGVCGSSRHYSTSRRCVRCRRRLRCRRWHGRRRAMFVSRLLVT